MAIVQFIFDGFNGATLATTIIPIIIETRDHQSPLKAISELVIQ